MKIVPSISLKSSMIYGAIGYFGVSFIYSYNYDENFGYKFSFSRLSSRFAGLIGRIHLPLQLRKPLLGTFASTYNVILDDMVKDIEEYQSFVDFFTREVKPREIDPNSLVLVSPADSKVLSITEINQDSTLLVKNINYSLGELITGKKGYQINGEILQDLKKTPDKQKSKLYSVIFYLNPGDYHRYHSPADFLIKRSNHIVGHLLPVKESWISTTPGLYESNERITVFGEYNTNQFMSLVFVGATNVGSMTLTFDPELATNQSLTGKFNISNIRQYCSEQNTDPINQRVGQIVKNLNLNNYQRNDKGVIVKKGQELGMFKLGSTVVMIFESDKQINWTIQEGQKVRYGQKIAELKLD